MEASLHIFKVGTRVTCSLAYAGQGIVFAVHGEQMPQSVSTIAGGMIVSGGSANFDVVFLTGSISRKLPEALIRGSEQWRVLDEIATAEEVQSAIDFANKTQADRETVKREAAAQFDSEVERLKTDPEFSKLIQDADIYSGVLAAKNIRTLLKSAFPGVKFSVRKNHYSSLVIEWLDGPLQNDIEEATYPFSPGYFCGLEDLYHDKKTPWSEVFGTAKYISVRRNFSNGLIEKAISEVFTELASNLNGIERPTSEQYQSGSLYVIQVPRMGDSLQRVIHQTLSRTRGN